MQECMKLQKGLPFYSAVLEHWDLNANSASFDANLENLNDSERLNANSRYSRQHN